MSFKLGGAPARGASMGLGVRGVVPPQHCLWGSVPQGQLQHPIFAAARHLPCLWCVCLQALPGSPLSGL